MTNLKYRAVFRFLNQYYVAASTTPDVHDGPYDNKAYALSKAREAQNKDKLDPNLVIDMTDVPEAELRGLFLS